MPQSYPDALSLSRKVLRLLIKLNILMGILIFGLLVASIVARNFMAEALIHAHGDPGTGLIIGMRVIMIIGICAVPLTHLVLTRLLAIVETVSLGDPFVSVNAARLQAIAWTVLALEILHLVVGAVAKAASTDAHPLDIGQDFSVTRWLAVLLCFVLARVFEHGARMREDLEGTV